jgi:hypothetical protein
VATQLQLTNISYIISYAPKNLFLEAQLPRSPDLKPLDFYLWDHLKTLVYSGAIKNEGTFHKRIFDGCQTILNFSQDF